MAEFLHAVRGHLVAQVGDDEVHGPVAVAHPVGRDQFPHHLVVWCIGVELVPQPALQLFAVLGVRGPAHEPDTPHVGPVVGEFAGVVERQVLAVHLHVGPVHLREVRAVGGVAFLVQVRLAVAHLGLAVDEPLHQQLAFVGSLVGFVVERFLQGGHAAQHIDEHPAQELQVRGLAGGLLDVRLLPSFGDVVVDRLRCPHVRGRVGGRFGFVLLRIVRLVAGEKRGGGQCQEKR